MVVAQTDFNLKPFNTFRMDVKCSEWVEYTEADDLPGIFARRRDIAVKHIGAGSNILFLGDFDGTILHSRILDIESCPGEGGVMLVRAGAGVTLDALIESCAASGLWGLENLSGIPGEVGSSAVQNVGAYGVEAGDLIAKVECYDTVTSEFVTFSRDDCRFGYRNSMFKKSENAGRYVITYVTFELRFNGDPRLDYGNLRGCFSDDELGRLTPMPVRQAVMDVRASKLPSVETVGSAGSFFKNPVITREEFGRLADLSVRLFGSDVRVPHYDLGENIKIPAAWLIDRCGMKGFRLGNAAVWQSQPLVIVNATGTATPDEIMALEQAVIDAVRSRFGITLSPEVEHVK